MDISTITVSVLSSVAASFGLVIVFWRSAIGGYLGDFFDRRLEDHRHELEISLETIRHRYEARILDLGEFITRKHERYVTVYDKLLVADGKIRELEGSIERRLTFEEQNKNDFRRFLEAYEPPLPDGKVESLLRIWDDNRSQAVGQAYEYIDAMKIPAAHLALTQAKNEVLASELYLSRPVAETSHELLKLLQRFLLVMEMRRSEGPEQGEILAVRDNLRDMMQNELKGDAGTVEPSGPPQRAEQVVARTDRGRDA